MTRLNVLCRFVIFVAAVTVTTIAADTLAPTLPQASSTLRGSTNDIQSNDIANEPNRLEGFDKAVEKLASFFKVLTTGTAEQKAGFEGTAKDLAFAYNVPLVASPTDKSTATTTAFTTAANQAEQASRCTLTINATNTQSLTLNCNSDKIRFVGIGDWGEKTATSAINAVRDGILAESANIDFVLNAGDNFYTLGVSSTSDSQWTNSWYNRYQIGTKLIVPWFSILGNHDHYGNAQAQIDFTKSTKPGAKYWVMPDEFFSADVVAASGKKMKMVFTDTITIAASDLDWVTTQVQDPTAEFVLALGYYHIYSQGGRGDNSDSNMQKLNNIWKASPKVKAYICGHEHDMQLLRANNIDYSLIGGGGRAVDFGEASPGTKAEKLYYARNYGYAVYEVDIAQRTMKIMYNIYNKSGFKVETKVFTRVY
uniref:Calcineurin-like phosphoesterase domain-containing protein n=1 Tax=Globisporangium ultimum (strain ATCC 200006 / CBS 805.95 / DAOM BR144) TaxID=431595 RepID=K3XB66_GLOUD